MRPFFLRYYTNTEIAKLFDSDRDGKANLTGCNAGWGCELVIEHQLDAYELRDTVEHNQGEYDILFANTVVRYQQGKPILYHAYVPHWSASVFKPDQDSIWLEVPFTSLPKVQGNVTEQETSFQGKNLRFAVDKIQVIANKKFLEANHLPNAYLSKLPFLLKILIFNNNGFLMEKIARKIFVTMRSSGCRKINSNLTVG